MIQLLPMDPPLMLFGVLQLLPPPLEELPPLMSPLLLVLRLSPFGRLVMPVLNLSGDGVLLCVSDTAGELLVVRDSGIGMLPLVAAGELEFRFKLNDGGLARLGDEAAISTGEMVVCSGRFPIEAVVATLDRELDELYRIPLRPGAIPGGSFRRSRSDSTPLLLAMVLLVLVMLLLLLLPLLLLPLGMASVSGARREKSTSPHCDSSRFSSSIRFWEAIFSFASRSISCSYSRSLRFNS